MESQAEIDTDTAKNVLIVLVTCPKTEAESLATKLLNEELIACANIVPAVLSVYKWKGEVAKDEESLLVMKTTANFYDRLEARVKELHSYEVPEVLALSVEKGSEAYIQWVQESLLKG